MLLFTGALLALACSNPTAPPEPPPPPPPPPIGPTPTVRLQSLTAGSFATCAIGSDTQSYCWGSNRYGELGSTQVPLETTVPTLVEGNHSFVHLSVSIINSVAGPIATCGLTSLGQTFCWGSADEGALAGIANDACAGREPFDTPPVPCSRVPIAVGGSLRFGTLAMGAGVICGLTASGSAFCWGRNELGQLGNGGHLDTTAPRQVAGNLQFTTITVGDKHACALVASGRAYCWGANGVGQLGSGNTNGTSVPVEVLTGQLFQDIGAGNDITCGLTLEGRVYCWGRGQITFALEPPWPFIPGTSIIPIPTAIGGDLTFREMTVGLVHACGLTTDGLAYCWGSNDNFQGGFEPSLSCTRFDNCGPTLINSEIRFQHLEAGTIHTCGRAVNSAIYCWGSNISGELGTPTSRPAVAIPLRVPLP